MQNRPDSSSPAATLRQIGQNFRLAGWVSFWVQLSLTIVSSLILLFANIVSRTPNTNPNNPSTGIGVTLTVGGILILGFTMYCALFRYIPFGRQLENGPNRPKKADTIQALRIGLMANLIGMFLGLLGAEAIVGVLAAKAFSQGVGSFVSTDQNRFIQPLDILVIQASINVILAQFAGIAASLWLLNRMNRNG